MLVATLAMSGADNVTKFKKKYTVDTYRITVILYVVGVGIEFIGYQETVKFFSVTFYFKIYIFTELPVHVFFG
jgi:hypothetical protein